MELELGLSLSNCTFHKIKSLEELDLIGYVNCEANNQDYYGDNLSSLSCEKSFSSVDDGDYDQEIRNYDNGLGRKKRRFDELEKSKFCKGETTLPLLLWDKHPNEDDSEHKRLCTSTSFTITKNESDEVVGWPPINTYRRKQNDTHPQQNHHGRRRVNCQAVENGGGCGGSPRSLYVKAQMQGCLIKRKIDLKLYHCYETLTSSLLQMFGKGQDSVDNYKLTYQDEEGDWLLAGDVPWRTFTQSVQRLKMVRKDD